MAAAGLEGRVNAYFDDDRGLGEGDRHWITTEMSGSHDGGPVVPFVARLEPRAKVDGLARR
jgi:hypothetical protein